MGRGHSTVAFLSILLLLSFSFGISIHAQIDVSPAQTANALAQKLAGMGVTIINPTLTCATQANGFFNVVSSNLALDSGIVLTTGRATTQGIAIGVNGQSALLASTDNGLPGDISLDALAGASTYDACDLEFDIIPIGDSLKFNYIFSSEEYINAVCGPYNDAFAFFISGPGISGMDNMALVPGTNIPVTINTINDGIPGRVGDISNCTMMGSGSPFTGYYIDNSSGQTLTHQGFTQVLQAIHAVSSCSTYHLKIVIADAGDALYDSGVFLKAGSLQTSSYDVSALVRPVADTSLAYCIKDCLPGRFRISQSQLSSRPQTIKFIVRGNAVSGIDYSPIADSVVIPANSTTADVIINGLPTPLNGPKIIQLFILSPYSCAGTDNITDSATLVIYDTLYVRMITPDTVICGNESVQLQLSGSDLLTYIWSPSTGLSNAAVMNPVVYTSATTTYNVTASLPGTTCSAKAASVTFTVKLTPDVILTPDTTICYNTQLPLSAATTSANLFYNYQWSGPGGFTSTILNPVINNATVQASGAYTLSVTIDTDGCKASASTAIVVNIPDTPIVVSPQIFCLNNTDTALSAIGNNLLWYSATDSLGDTSAPIPPTGEIAVYNYAVTQTVNNCESPKAQVEVEVKKCCDGDIFIPTAFTPNGDGLNDRFRPLEDYGYFIESMYVFNRWGQVVYSGLQDGWDGTFGGKQGDVGAYFYFITFGCILGGTVERKGDVILIR